MIVICSYRKVDDMPVEAVRVGQPKIDNHTQKQNKKVKVASLVGSSIGIAAAVASIAQKAKKGEAPVKFSQIEYHTKDILKLGAASVVGGLAGGVMTDKDSNKKAKLREAIHQFGGNILVPVSMLALNTKLLDRSGFKLPTFKSAGKAAKVANRVLGGLPGVAVTIASLVTGMEIGNKIFNKISDKIFHEKEKREVKPSDYSAHIDDMCMASSLIFKGPQVQQITNKLLPLSFLIAGFQTGTHENGK